jgi:hypothetical protein
LALYIAVSARCSSCSAGRVAVVRPDRDADAGRHGAGRPAERKRPDERLLDLRRHDRGVVRPLELAQEHDELVPAPAGHGVGRSHRLSQPVGDHLEHRVAAGMPQRVVDDLEIVEVDVQHGERPAVTSGLSQLAAHAVVEQPPVG